LWRDFDALLLARTVQGDGPRRPEVLEFPPEVADLRVLALGFEQETGKVIDRQFVSSATPPIYDYLKERDGQAALRVGSLRAIAERYGLRLELATQMAWQLYTDADKRRSCAWSRTAAARYWPAAEAEFWRRLSSGNQAADGAQQYFRTMARAIYDEVTRPALSSVRGGHARSRARFELYGGLPKPRSGAARTRDATPSHTARETSVTSEPENLKQQASDRLRPERAFVAAVRTACKDPGLQQALRVAASRHTDRRRMKVAEALDEAIPELERLGDALKPYHLVASLIAQLPRQRALAVSSAAQPDGYSRSLGRCVAQAVARHELDAEVAKRQLQRLLWASPAVVYAQLPHLIRRMPERPDAVDYAQLLRDLRRWPTARREISERWNDEFFAELTRISAYRAEADDAPAAS
jgi:CRISPR type I-E-associated protein CasB/Cse2